MARILNALARPWDLPPFLFIVFLALNRILLKQSLNVEESQRFGWSRALPYLAWECLLVFAGAVLFALCIALLLKFIRLENWPKTTLNDLISLALKSQSVYLFAAPIALLWVSLNPWLGASISQNAAQFLKSIFQVSPYVVLFFLLKNKFETFGEIRLLTLTLAPYLLFVGFVIAFLAAIFAAITLILFFK